MELIGVRQIIVQSKYNQIRYCRQLEEMRIDSPDISWHGQKDRILSIDFHPFCNQFASAGSDDRKFIDEEHQGTEGCIKIWELCNNGKKLDIKILYGLAEADTNTNVIRFSPNGALMASGSDDKSITIWHKRENTKSIASTEKVFRWSSKFKLMGHSQDVIDLKWTKNSKIIISVGMDGRLFIWSVQKKYHLKVCDEHTKFVQGVAIDPKFEYIISASNDRTVKVWNAVKTKRHQYGFNCYRTLKKYCFNKKEQDDDGNEINEANEKGFRIFADESVPTFFRRPDFSPDGELFVLPAGIWQKTPQSAPQYCSFLYRKRFLDKPSLIFPTRGQAVLVCKFCPLLFKKANTGEGMIEQDYYMVFAVATATSVFVYSTMQLKPIFGMGNFHYASITDLVWKGSEILAIASSDGFCSFMIFDDGELGEQYQAEGELAELLKNQEFVPPIVKDQPIVMQEQRVIESRNSEGQLIKKTIVPVVIQKL